MKNNAYFDEMYRIGCEWSEAHRAHEALKEQIIKEKGWDSEELKAWYEEEEQMKFPFSSGANKAFRAWRYSDGDEIIFDDHCWDTEVHDFIDTLRKAGFKSFVVINQSTALMENLHGFAAEGCTMEGLCTIYRTENHYGSTEPVAYHGIRFTL